MCVEQVAGLKAELTKLKVGRKASEGELAKARAELLRLSEASASASAKLEEELRAARRENATLTELQGVSGENEATAALHAAKLETKALADELSKAAAAAKAAHAAHAAELAAAQGVAREAGEALVAAEAAHAAHAAALTADLEAARGEAAAAKARPLLAHHSSSYEARDTVPPLNIAEGLRVGSAGSPQFASKSVSGGGDGGDGAGSGGSGGGGGGVGVGALWGRMKTPRSAVATPRTAAATETALAAAVAKQEETAAKLDERDGGSDPRVRSVYSWLRVRARAATPRRGAD